MYRKEGGAFPDPILNLTWNYTDPNEPDPEELAKEMNGRALADLKEHRTVRRFPPDSCWTASPSCATTARTASGCWIFTGCLHREGQPDGPPRHRGSARPGIAPGWAWAWPANRRILYNRASADLDGKPWNPDKPLIEWNGSRWVGIDVPDYGPTVKPSDSVGPFIMNAEGVGRLFARDLMVEGPFPEHYEPFESPAENILHPKVKNNPAARVFASDRAAFGTSADFPYVGDHLPADRTFPFLDQARADQRHPAAGGVHRDRRDAGEAEGDRTGRLGAGVLEARRGRVQGLRDQAHRAR